MDRARTRAVLNAYEAITADFARKPDLRLPGERMRREIETRLSAGALDVFNAHVLAERIFGDSITANMILTGFAYQRGLVPITSGSIEEAIRLNGAAVPMNLDAFRLGRHAAAFPAEIARLTQPEKPIATQDTLDALISRRASFLADYQDGAFTARYLERVAAIRSAERAKVPGKEDLTRAAAEGLFKLMAVKDEYEVARLYTDGTFARDLAEQFESVGRVSFHLAPPLIAKINPSTGRPAKIAFGPWMMTAFRILASAKWLRGTWLDPFARTAERKLERQLAADYETLLNEIVDRLTPETHAIAVSLASLPRDIKGFGPVKLESIRFAQRREAELLERLRNPVSPKSTRLAAAE
jgi:indolepyruvate ferredoxin oxidoreductase